MCYFCICKFCFPPFKCHFPGHACNCFETQFSSVLHPGSLVSCHSFFTLFLYFNNRSRPGRLLFNSYKMILLVDSLYVNAMEAVKAHTALLASTPELISTLVICLRLGLETAPNL
jgi:hypothetical protein